jgi:hypothetical protein
MKKLHIALLYRSFIRVAREYAEKPKFQDKTARKPQPSYQNIDSIFQRTDYLNL